MAPKTTDKERVMRTYSIQVATDRKIQELAETTYRGKQDIIDLAVSRLYDDWKNKPQAIILPELPEPKAA